MEASSADSLLLTTGVAVGIGLLMGAERERSKGGGPEREIAGVRTFALASLLGAFGSVLGNPLALATFGLVLGAMTLAGYLRTRQSDPGVTTEVALMVAFALGALSLSRPAFAASGAVVVTVLLASRTWLHELVTTRLTDEELRDGLVLAAAALVVLPLLPDRMIDPWQVFNPRRMWVVVVLVLAINAIGYVGLRLWGASRGLLIAGVLGGFVSSVTTHGAMGQRAKEDIAILNNAAAAATLSSVTTALALILVVGAVYVELATTLAPACIAAALTSGASAWLLYRRGVTHAASALQLGRPLRLSTALVIGAVLSAVLVLVTGITRVFGAGGGLAGAAAAGFADAHSGAVAAAVLGRNEALPFHMAQLAALLSFTANAITKIIVSVVSGPSAYAQRIAAGLLASVAAAWGTWWLTVSI
jgi:uncharacterized membrane protein (DUF4010 family)